MKGNFGNFLAKKLSFKIFLSVSKSIFLADDQIPSLPTPLEDAAPLVIRVFKVSETDADLFVLGDAANFTFYEVFTYMGSNNRPNTQMVKSVGTLTPVKLYPLSPGKLRK